MVAPFFVKRKEGLKAGNMFSQVIFFVRSKGVVVISKHEAFSVYNRCIVHHNATTPINAESG